MSGNSQTSVWADARGTGGFPVQHSLDPGLLMPSLTSRSIEGTRTALPPLSQRASEREPRAEASVNRGSDAGTGSKMRAAGCGHGEEETEALAPTAQPTTADSVSLVIFPWSMFASRSDYVHHRESGRGQVRRASLFFHFYFLPSCSVPRPLPICR